MLLLCPKTPLLLALLVLAGCAGPVTQGKSPMKAAQMSPDSVALDMFFVRVPFGDPTLNEALWKEIDEQPLSPELREKLARNGFRVGVTSGSMPAELSKLLELGGKPATNGGIEEASFENLDAEPRVMRRHLQLRTGKRSEIVASAIYDRLPLLMCEPGQLCGQTYEQAQGVFAARSFPQPDGRVRLQLVPELHYGQQQQTWVGGPGMMRLEAGRKKRKFDDMTLTTDLEPGAMLVLSSLSNRSGSLGHYFFTENNGRLEQKLLVIRVSQTQHDPLFTPPEPLKLDDEE